MEVCRSGTRLAEAMGEGRYAQADALIGGVTSLSPLMLDSGFKLLN